MATAAAFPIDTALAGAEIKQLIQEKGIESLTSKIIRKHLEAKFNCQLADFKSEIDRLTMEKIQEKQTKSSSEKDESSSEDEINDLSPAKTSSNNKKKAERAVSDEIDDMVSSVKRRRACVTVKQRREPAAKKKKADPDAPNNRKGKSAFSRICVLSDELSNILGQKYMRRSDVVKAMWAYFRTNDLLDPKDRRMVILNDALKKVFSGKRIQAFGMMKGLKTHIKDADFLDDETRRQMELDFEAAEKNNAVATVATSSGIKTATESIMKKENMQSEGLNNSDDQEEEKSKANALAGDSNDLPDINLIAGVQENGQDKNAKNSSPASSSSSDSSSSSNSSSDDE